MLRGILFFVKLAVVVAVVLWLAWLDRRVDNLEALAHCVGPLELSFDFCESLYR